jgi:hypothetical protein
LVDSYFIDRRAYPGEEAKMKRAIAEHGVRRVALRAVPCVVLVAAVAAETAISSPALAQGAPTAPAARDNPVPPTMRDNAPPDATEGRAQAPIGHRQPRPRDLPTNLQRGEGSGIERSPVDRDLDQKLQICRGC